MTDFVQDYIKQCMDNGINNIAEICKSAKNEIQKIDQSLQELTNLKIRQENLKKVIKQLGGGETATKPKNSPNIVNTRILESELDPVIKEICLNICAKIEEQQNVEPLGLRPKGVTVAEILSLYPNVEMKLIYYSVKWLWDNQIIIRSTADKNAPLNKGIKFNTFFKKDNQNENN